MRDDVIDDLPAQTLRDLLRKSIREVETAEAELATLREALREARDEIVDWGKRHPIVTPHFVKPLVTRIDALLAPSGNGEGT